jgi:ketosteroid isomerase-like protein
VSATAEHPLKAMIDAYNDAWNRHDVDAICALHAPGMVFENHTAHERAEGDAVRGHIAAIFAGWPDLRFTTRRLYVRDDLVVQEWTAHATHASGTRVEWDGMDVIPCSGGLIERKDVYSDSGAVRRQLEAS